MKSWERRGHDRKPNFIVRGIYAVADWLGDFGPMLATAKQGAINAGLIIANFIILIGILITSAVHSLELLRYAGAKGGLEYVMLIVFEAVFLVSSFLVDQAVKRGMSFKQSWQVWLPFFIGLVFVFFSNFLSMDTNLAGMLIGGITPFLLLFIKWMLDWQVNVRGKFDEEKRAERAKKVAENTAENEVEKISDGSEMNPVTTRDTADKILQKTDQKEAQKLAQKNAENNDEDISENGTESAPKKAQKSAKKSARKSVKRTRRKSSKRDREKILEKATGIIKKALKETGEYPTHEAVAALAHTTRYYAQEARKIVEAELDQEQQKEAQQQEEQEKEESKQQLLEKAS